MFNRESLKYLKNREWQHKHVQKYLETLRQSVLSQKHEATEIALGFRLHFFDIFLEELARAGEGELPRKRAHNFLEPFYEVKRKTQFVRQLLGGRIPKRDPSIEEFLLQILAYCKSPMIVEGVRDKIFYELIKLSVGSLEDVEEEEEDDEDPAGNSRFDQMNYFALFNLFLSRFGKRFVGQHDLTRSSDRRTHR